MERVRRWGLAAVVTLVASGLLVSCSSEAPADESSDVVLEDATATGRPASPRDEASAGAEGQDERSEPDEPEVLASDGRPRLASLSIPGIGLRDLAVVPYRGRTDDAPGTAIQNRGRAASPHGPQGGVGPGGVGNYQVTAHRLSSTRAFELLPRLRRGDEVSVEAGAHRYVYEITATRETSFRQPRSLRAQRAGVPGKPGLDPTRAMITLSTCATVEDHAAGNWWADRFGNPEHRIDKIGVLVRIRPA